jgi:uncharacterized protein (TIGR02598 family)
VKQKLRSGDGFSLVEVALALAIASFCLITLLALLPVGVQNYRDADNQSAMVNLATMVQRDLEATPSSATTATSPRFSFSVPAVTGSGDTNPQIVYVDASGTTATGTARIYRINVAFSPPLPAGTNLRGATTARILITWPAMADASTTTWPANYSDMFETTVSLNRN